MEQVSFGRLYSPRPQPEGLQGHPTEGRQQAHRARRSLLQQPAAPAAKRSGAAAGVAHGESEHENWGPETRKLVRAVTVFQKTASYQIDSLLAISVLGESCVCFV